MPYEALPRVSSHIVASLFEEYGAGFTGSDPSHEALQSLQSWTQQELLALWETNPHLGELLEYFREDYWTLLAGLPLTPWQKDWLIVACMAGMLLPLQAVSEALDEAQSSSGR